MILIILISTLLFFTSSVSAQEFSLYSENPIIKRDGSNVGTFQPHVLKKENTFSIWFAESDGIKSTIKTMKSTNGIDWYDRKTLQLSNRNSVHDPFMFENDNEYNLYFASSNFGDISIWKTTSLTEDGFQKGTEIEVLKSEYPWEGSNLSCPSVIKDGSFQYLFYSGSGSGNWAIGLATSPDGVTWEKCKNNPIIPSGSGPQIVKQNDIFYLFYQSPTGLKILQSNALNGCETVWTAPTSISPPFGDPSPVVVKDDLWLYGTFGTLDGQTIGLAANTMIAKPNYPIVIIPGMFASWNEQAILHNTTVSYDAWKLNKNVSEYDSIIKTLENKGKVIDKDLFIFPYDWRKQIIETSQNLDLFINDKIWSSNSYQPIQIIGHSLGGIVGRIYSEKYSKKPIKNVVTLGSPHLGAVQAYKPLAGGELERDNTFMWIAEKIILALNKTSIQSDRETFDQKFPVLRDVLPAFPFLKNEAGNFIASSISNSLLPVYPIQSLPIVPKIMIGGTGIQTLGGYTLGARTGMDNLFNNFPDGHPISSWQEDGDGLALFKSALNQTTPIPLSNHGELIYSKENIKTILSKLNINVTDADIPQGKATIISPSIFLFIQSPATIKVIHNEDNFESVEGMIHIQNPESGEYSIKVTGKDAGVYTIHAWLIGKTDDIWTSFTKSTILGKVDEYIITFDMNSGGIVQEYIQPTSIPTTIPTINPKPTIRPTIKPTCKPSPTKKPHPTHKPTPPLTKDKFKYDQKKEKEYLKFIRLVLQRLLKVIRK